MKKNVLSLLDRSAERRAELVLAILAFRKAAGVLEEVRRVEFIVAQKFPRAAVDIGSIPT